MGAEKAAAEKLAAEKAAAEKVAAEKAAAEKAAADKAAEEIAIRNMKDPIQELFLTAIRRYSGRVETRVGEGSQAVRRCRGGGHDKVSRAFFQGCMLILSTFQRSNKNKFNS